MTTIKSVRRRLYSIRGITAALVIGYCALAAPKASAQSYGMSFSIYADIYWEYSSNPGLTVEAFQDAYDDSWGCTHFDYYSTAELSHVAGPQALEGTEGLYVDVEAPFNDLDGFWSLNTAIDFECECGGGFTINYSNAIVANRVPKYLSTLSTGYVLGPPAPYAFNVGRLIHDQFRRPLHRQYFVDESLSPNPPTGTCPIEGIDMGDDWSDEGGVIGVDTYFIDGDPGFECASSTTQTFVIGGHPIATSYTITYRRSGVDVIPHNEAE